MANEPTKSPTPITNRYRWIVCNKDGPVGFPLPATKHAASKTVTPDGTVLTINPGANIVDVKRWEACKAADPDREVDGDKVQGEINRLLSTDIPDATHKNRQPAKAGKRHIVEGALVANVRDPLAGMSESDAVTLVREFTGGVTVLGTAFNGDVIRGLLKVEKRSSVNEALHKALESFARGQSMAVG